jgi:hypothetical protein
MAVGAVLAANDDFTDVDATEDRLIEAGVKPDHIAVMPDASHLSAVTNYQKTADYLFPLIEEQHNSLRSQPAI